jgi:hypothetical protein
MRLLALTLCFVNGAALRLGGRLNPYPIRASPRSSWPVCTAEPPQLGREEDRVNLTGDRGAIVTSADAAEVGNLIADDEWLGLTMELAILVRRAPGPTPKWPREAY